MVECKNWGAYLMGLTSEGYSISSLGYYVSVGKGVDKLRNLVKCVTVEKGE